MGDEGSLHDLSCVMHVHSTYSDGTATVSELLDAARESAADALLLTDHDSIGARDDGWEGHHDGVFLLVGLEVSPKQGHYLAFGVDEMIPDKGRTLGDRRRRPGSRRRRLRGAPVLARRAHARPIDRPQDRPPPRMAAAERRRGLDGVELWSVLTDAAEAWRTPR